MKISNSLSWFLKSIQFSHSEQINIHTLLYPAMHLSLDSVSLPGFLWLFFLLVNHYGEVHLLYMLFYVPVITYYVSFEFKCTQIDTVGQYKYMVRPIYDISGYLNNLTCQSTDTYKTSWYTLSMALLNGTMHTLYLFLYHCNFHWHCYHNNQCCFFKSQPRDTSFIDGRAVISIIIFLLPCFWLDSTHCS